MATQDYNRGVNFSLVSQMPEGFDIITHATETKTGNWIAIEVYGAKFPDNETSFLITENGQEVGRNLSPLNDKIPDGHRILGHFTKLDIVAEADPMILIAYKP